MPDFSIQKLERNFHSTCTNFVRNIDDLILGKGFFQWTYLAVSKSI